MYRIPRAVDQILWRREYRACMRDCPPTCPPASPTYLTYLDYPPRLPTDLPSWTSPKF